MAEPASKRQRVAANGTEEHVGASSEACTSYNLLYCHSTAPTVSEVRIAQQVLVSRLCSHLKL